MRRTLLLLIGSVGLLYSCVSTAPPVFNPNDTSPQKIYSQLDRQFRSITHFRGEATIMVDTPEQSGQVSGDITVEPSQAAEIILKSPFGGKVGRLVIRHQYLLFYNANDKLQYIGSPDNTGIPALPEIFSGQQDLVTILAGMMNLPDNMNQTMLSDSMDGPLYQINFRTDSTTSSYWYDPTVAMFSKYRETELPSGRQTEIELGKFTEVDGMQLPRTIKISQPGKRRMLAIYYHSINISRENSANAL